MTPWILAVDTTHEHGSLAVSRGDELIEEVGIDAPAGFAHVIYGELRALLARAGIEVGRMDCFAAATGPGSFTGVRVGLACVKGLAEATGKPAVGVSNLRAVAAFGSAELRAVVMDARRAEIYGAVYDRRGRLAAPEVVAPFSSWLATLPEGDVELVCLDYRPAVEGTRWEGARVTQAPRSLAGAIARLALEEYRRGEARDPAALDANYVRRSDAEMMWKDGD